MTSFQSTLRAVLIVAALAPVAISLAACNTTAGAGKDISATGHAITNTADDSKPKGP